MPVRTKNSNDSWVFVCDLCWGVVHLDTIRSHTQLLSNACVVCDKEFYGVIPTWV